MELWYNQLDCVGGQGLAPMKSKNFLLAGAGVVVALSCAVTAVVGQFRSEAEYERLMLATPTPIPAGGGISVTPSELQQALDRWHRHGIQAYEITVNRVAFADARGPRTLRVEGDQVDRVTYPEGNSAAALRLTPMATETRGDLKAFTVSGPFAEVADLTSKGPFQMPFEKDVYPIYYTVEFDAAFGYPKLISMDLGPDASGGYLNDVAWSIRVQSLKVLRSGRVGTVVPGLSTSTPGRGTGGLP